MSTARLEVIAARQRRGPAWALSKLLPPMSAPVGLAAFLALPVFFASLMAVSLAIEKPRVVEWSRPDGHLARIFHNADRLARGEDLAARPRRAAAARRRRLDRDVAPVQHLPDLRGRDRRRARPDDQAAPLAAAPHGAVPVRPGSARRPDDLELARARRVGARRRRDRAQPRPLHDRPGARVGDDRGPSRLPALALARRTRLVGWLRFAGDGERLAHGRASTSRHRCRRFSSA